MLHQLFPIVVLAGVAHGFLFTQLVTSCSKADQYHSTGETLNSIIADIITDTDKNKNGVIDLDEARVELLSQWAGDNKTNEVTKAQFISLFSNKYREDPAISAQFFDNLDETGDGLLTETDFILQALELDHDLSLEVSLAEFRSFIYMHHPFGCKTNS